MNKVVRRIASIIIVLSIVYIAMPTHVKNALIHLHANITDWKIFDNNIVENDTEVWEWHEGDNYNKQNISSEDREYLEKHESVAFLVIQNDSIIHEEYWDSWQKDSYSNVFSVTKSIVSLLVGVALDEGFIKSLDDSIADYLPEFNKAPERNITIKDLLTMSSGLSWDEAYSSLFSVTTKGYYGDAIKKTVMNLHTIKDPGKQFIYKSGDTQLLSFIVENVTGKTISEYASEKLWKPMQASQVALWSTDKKNGDEKTFCCFNTNARDIARFARLLLNNGNWNGKQLVSEAYIKEAITPASYLENEFGTGALDYYGYQIWIHNYNGQNIPYLRGHLGQYIYAIPNKNAIVVRLGHRKDEQIKGAITADIENYLNIAYKFLK